MSTPLLTVERSGVYRAPPNAAALRDTLAGSGAAWFDVDLAHVRVKEDLLSVFARACGFPSAFGENWDALADALQDLSWRPADGYVFHVRHAAAAARTLGSEWAMLLEILKESATYWRRHAKAFVVLVDEAAELPPWT